MPEPKSATARVILWERLPFGKLLSSSQIPRVPAISMPRYGLPVPFALLGLTPRFMPNPPVRSGAISSAAGSFRHNPHR